MARGRILDKQISLSTKLSALWDTNAAAALFYTWLLPHVDDYGRQEADPNVLKAAVCPLVTSVDLDGTKTILRQLEVDGLLEKYKVDDRWFIQVVNFETFQRFPRGREARFPGKDGVKERFQRKQSGTTLPSKEVTNEGRRTPVKESSSDTRAAAAPPEGGAPAAKRTEPDKTGQNRTSGRQSAKSAASRDLKSKSNTGSSHNEASEKGLQARDRDVRKYPDKVNRFPPFKEVKVPVQELIGNRLVDQVVRLGQFGGYGSREVGVFEWQQGPEDKHAMARHVWDPERGLL